MPAFLLVERGICNFEVKVHNAQDAGFQAVIVYNNEDDRDLVTSESAFGLSLFVISIVRLLGC